MREIFGRLESVNEGWVGLWVSWVSLVVNR